jgi:hypothetical protein
VNLILNWFVRGYVGLKLKIKTKPHKGGYVGLKLKIKTKPHK